jgi:signal transduction histidine kinase
LAQEFFAEHTLAPNGNAALRDELARPGRPDEQLLFLFDSLPELAWSSNQDGTGDYVNAQWLEYVGAVGVAPLALNWILHLHPEDAERVKGEWENSLAHGVPLRLQCRLRRADGSYRWFRSRLLPRCDEHGRILQWAGIHADEEDERQRATDVHRLTARLEQVVDERTAELQRVSERLLAATSGANVGIWEWDCEREEVLWDDRTYQLYGVDPNAYDGPRDVWRNVVNAADAQVVSKALERALAGTAEFDVTFRVRSPTGYKHLHTVAKVQRDQTGKPRRMLGASWDVSDRQRALEELGRSNAELEQFAYVASHDLQEPLRAIAGCTQILAHRYRGQLAADADTLVGHIVDGAARMKNLIEDLLSLSRVGSQESCLQRVDAADAVASALRNLQAGVVESGAEVTLGDLPVIVGDPTQILQLFQNLLGNALKYRRKGSPAVFIGSVPTAEGLEFSVTDNGIGIAPEYFERIFGVFQRLHTREEYPGTGIGLALCRKIVERHGGRIWVESEPGTGASFHFVLRGWEKAE